MQRFFTQKKTIKEFSTDTSKLHSVQIFLWARGIAVTGHNSEHEVLTAIAYSFDEVYPLRNLEQVILNEPLLADPYMIGNVWLAVSRNMILPSGLDRRDAIDNLFKKYFFVEADETMTLAHDISWGVDIFFPKKQLLKDALHQFFPNRKQQFLIAPKSFTAFHARHDYYAAFVLFLEHSCSLTITKGEQLIHNYIFDTDDAKEILFRTREIVGDDTSLSYTHFYITGINDAIPHWIDELKSYGYHVNEHNDFTLINAFKLLSSCA